MKKIVKKANIFLSAIVMVVLFLINPISAKAAVSLESLMQQYVGSTWNGYYYGEQCKGFANYIFYRLWDVKYIGSYASQKYYLPNPSGAHEVG